MGDGAAEALHLIEHFEEDVDDGILVLLAGGLALGINIEKDDIRGGVCCQLHIGQYNRVNDLLVLDKVVHGLPVAHLTVLQKVGEDLQEVRFTTSKEAGNPHAHLRRCPHNALFIRSVEVCKMLLQLSGHNIFLKFLGDVRVLALTDNNNALNLTVNLLGEHFFDLHCDTSITSQAGRLCNSYRP